MVQIQPGQTLLATSDVLESLFVDTPRPCSGGGFLVLFEKASPTSSLLALTGLLQPK
jgi:hypothetical protein